MSYVSRVFSKHVTNAIPHRVRSTRFWQPFLYVEFSVQRITCVVALYVMHAFIVCRSDHLINSYRFSIVVDSRHGRSGNLLI